MSILIKGMEMPKDKEIILRIDEEGQVYNIYGEYPTKIYEAIEIPPHGRLIDADALIELLKECEDVLDNSEMFPSLVLVGIINDIKKAPTIIESEGDE